MKIEDFSSFHSSARVKILAQQRPGSMETDLDIFFGDFEDVRRIGRAYVFYVAQYENGSVSIRQFFDRFFQQPPNLRV